MAWQTLLSLFSVECFLLSAKIMGSMCVSTSKHITPHQAAWIMGRIKRQMLEATSHPSLSIQEQVLAYLKTENIFLSTHFRRSSTTQAPFALSISPNVRALLSCFVFTNQRRTDDLPCSITTEQKLCLELLGCKEWCVSIFPLFFFFVVQF